MRVLLTVASFAPEYGGPALSVSRLGVALAEQGVDVTLWAPDGSAVWSPVISDDAPVDRKAGSLQDVLDSSAAELVHDNGLWLPHNHRIARHCRMRGMARVVSLRGMLEPWALAAKGWKKRIAWHAYQKSDLRSATAILTTAPSERDNFLRLGVDADVHVVPNGMDLPERMAHRVIRSKAVRTALFVSRIHPKKGLPMLMDAWARVDLPDWRLVIAGPDQNGHRDVVAARAILLGIEDVVDFVGPVYGEEKQALFESADLFVLPTHSENFGMAVAEALGHGLPVITTTGAPWGDLVNHACGWWVEPQADAIADALTTATALSQDERCAMGIRGRELVRSKFAWSPIALLTIEVYRRALAASALSEAR